MDYEVDPVRQAIADSWPDNIDTSYSRKEWGFNPKYDLAGMTELMLKAIEEKNKINKVWLSYKSYNTEPQTKCLRVSFIKIS